MHDGPVVIIQAITTRWTRASRGAPQATIRAAVPEVAALPTLGRPLPGTFVHELEALEERRFTLDEIVAEERSELPVTVAGVQVALDDDLVVVTRTASRWGGWPPRPRARVVFRLAPGDWGRYVCNARIGGARDWAYLRVVVNVAALATSRNDGANPRSDLFVATAPTYVVNEEEQLR